MRNPGIFLALLAFIAPLALYLYHLSPTYIPIDSAEFTLCMRFWGLCHPPGFPLYVMLGHFFLKIFPFGEIIWRANLLSAIFGSLTILMLYLTLTKLEVKREIAFLGAMMMAVSTSFWEFSLAADVFTFGTFLVVLSLFLAFSNRKFLALFVLGLSASHFYLTAVLWPVYVWYFWGKGDSSTGNKARLLGLVNAKGKAWLLIWLVVFGLGFFPQLVLFFRMQQGPEINWGHAQGIGGFIDYVRRKEFGSGFLLSNPALVYSPLKNIKQIGLFAKTLLFEFGLVLPVAGVAGVVFSKIEKRREYLLVLFAFLLYSFIQLFLLSTIEPGGEGNPFQLNKFYLVSFLLAVILAVLTLDYLIKRFFEDFAGIFVLLLSALIVIYALVNWQTMTFRGSYFSRNLVLDSLDQLPPGAIAITVDHVMYFGSLYEQKVNGLYTDKTILYFPNEKNRDNESYHPELFNRLEDREFTGRVESEYKMGAAERYVLSLISKNLDRDIYILQGDFEYNFFRYLSGVSEPYGLWSRVKKDGREVDAEDINRLFSSFRNKDFKRGDFFLKQQGFEATVYAVSYYQSALRLASLGKYNEAIEFFNKSLAIDPSKTNVQNDISLVSRVRELEGTLGQLTAEKNSDRLLELGQGLFTIKNYGESAKVYEEIIKLGVSDAQVYNNAASAYANLGEVAKARDYYEKALELDPTLDVAQLGLEKLGE